MSPIPAEVSKPQSVPALFRLNQNILPANNTAIG
jgi:hypothetical protein